VFIKNFTFNFELEPFPGLPICSTIVYGVLGNGSKPWLPLSHVIIRGQLRCDRFDLQYFQATMGFWNAEPSKVEKYTIVLP
jgi:hypothetical protein